MAEELPNEGKIVKGEEATAKTDASALASASLQKDSSTRVAPPLSEEDKNTQGASPFTQQSVAMEQVPEKKILGDQVKSTADVKPETVLQEPLHDKKGSPQRHQDNKHFQLQQHQHQQRQQDQLSETHSELDKDEQPTISLADATIPLLHYTRVQSTGIHRPLPRTDAQGNTISLPFQTTCSCSLMGRILLSSENVVGPHSNTEDETPVLTLLQQYFPHLVSSGQPDQPIELFVTVMGFVDGTIVILDARTHALISSSSSVGAGGAAATGGGSSGSSTALLQMREGSSTTKFPIVAFSMDATGTVLAAIDAGGMCTIFEMTKFQIQLGAAHDTTASTSSGSNNNNNNVVLPSSASATPDTNVFSSFMSVFRGSTAGSQAQASASRSSSTNINTNPRRPQHPALVITNVQTSRIPYPKNFSTPTTLAVDPAYKRRREKAILVGFADGRLVQTKRGLIFQRRNDTIVHQALPPAPADATMAPGIQSLVWRGNLAAWAEPSGIRLLDAETISKIAHIDRPVGARPSLYPTVKNMTARLCFETAHRLLVAWGDCLLQLTIHESSSSTQTTTATASPTSGTANSGGNNNNVVDKPPVMVRRRTVECTMAWELDCIAAGVAPLDERHVLVLGLVPMTPEDDENAMGGAVAAANDANGKDTAVINEVELQVLSRVDGNIVYSDLLPMLKTAPEPKPKRGRNKKEKPGESIALFSLLSTFQIPRMGDLDETQTGDMLGSDFDPVSIFAGSAVPRSRFRDPHLQWDLSHVSPDPLTPQENSFDADSSDDNDDVSVDSDDYAFVQRPLDVTVDSLSNTIPPVLWIIGGSDALVARVRNLDDVISAVQDRPAVALQRALCHRSQLRKHNLDDLVNAYFAALLRLSSSSSSKRLSLRRMKLAASAMPVLLGGKTAMWKQWIEALEDLPGALFILRNVLPVRDPVLPPEYYTTVLRKMFQQILQMKGSAEASKLSEKLVGEAESHFLLTLLGWGTSLCIREHLQYFKYLQGIYPTYKAPLIATEDMARRRQEQSSAVYLSFPAESIEMPTDIAGVGYLPPTDRDELQDALYNADALCSFFESSLKNNQIQTEESVGKVALDAMAKMKIGRGQYGAALKYILLLGSRYGSLSLDEVENSAVASVEHDTKAPLANKKFPYAYVLSMIETKHLHQMLLDQSLISAESPVPPIIALIQLVGIDLAGDFLVQNCVPVRSGSEGVKRTAGERLGTLSLDVVARQLEASPKILYWYLHSIFLRKPEVYVKFGSTANPPEAVTRLHRKALDLYIKFAGEKKDSVNVLRGIDAYRVTETTTPLLSFLKVVLQLGGINPAEVAKQLSLQRKGGGEMSSIFALELAYIMDHHGVHSEENAKVVLDLYLNGARSLMLAVSFAQRTKEYKSELWQILIDHCLSNDKKRSDGRGSTRNLFGSLLEAAALSGADLAQLVTKIPHGMAIEGLRPRLVGAVSDYRWKLQMHESANEVASKEISDLIREYEHRSRRGKRYEPSDRIEIPGWARLDSEQPSPQPKAEEQTAQREVLARTLRPKTRPQRYSLSYSLPVR